MHRTRHAAASMIFVFVFTLPALAIAGPPDASELQPALDEAIEHFHGVGLAARVTTPDGSWAGASGYASAQKTPLRPDDRFRVASITKVFVAVTVLQLVEEGKLALDDTLDRWFPKVPHAGDITVRNLLNHTSGIPDYLGDDEVQEHIREAWKPEELVARAVSGGKLDFTPGTKHDYSNTNYIILGRIIERTTGKPVAEEIRRRILKPLALNDTFMEGYEKGTLRVRGYMQDPDTGLNQDSTDTEHPSVSWTAGSMVSSTGDLTRLFRGLFSGKLLSASMLKQMTAPTKLSDGGVEESYGLGLERTRTPWGMLYYHTGSIPGFLSEVGYMPAHDTTIAVLSNSFALPPSAVSNELAFTTLGPPPVDPQQRAQDVSDGLRELNGAHPPGGRCP